MSGLLNKIIGRGSPTVPSQQSAPQNPKEKFEAKMAKTPAGKAVLSTRAILRNKTEGKQAEDGLEKALQTLEKTTIEDPDEKLWTVHSLEELVLSAHGGIRPRIISLIKTLRTL